MIQTGRWKPSIFNVVARAGERHMLFNSVTSHTLALTHQQLGIVQDCLDGLSQDGGVANEELAYYLAYLGFVVPRDEDEYEREHAKWLATRASKGRLYIVVAPTMACNLRCSYCFQQELARNRWLQPDVQQGIVEFVRRKAPGARAMAVQWFGGEPLLAYGQIAVMTEAFLRICDEHGIEYHAEMLTNGLLLTPQMIAGLSGLRVKAIQIPLDGTPATYAHRKGVSLQRAETFYHSLADNMPALLNVTGSVTIRINVDRSNVAEARDVIALFKAHGVIDPRLDFRLGFLNTRDGLIDCIPHECFSHSEFSDQEVAFRNCLAAEGYRVYDRPEAIDHPCTAVLDHSYTFDPEGNIGKCVPAIGSRESLFARIYPANIERTLAETEGRSAYPQFDPFTSARCSGCNLLPACLGSCVRQHLPGATGVCYMKSRLGDKLAFYHDFYSQRA